MPVDPVRDAAIDVLLRVSTKNVHIAQAVDRTLRRKKGRLSPRGRRFMTQLVYGTTRHALLADHILRPLLHQPLEKLPLPILLILRMGVFQALFADNVTFPAMVHTSVDLAKRRGHAGTARLVNAVLKRVPETFDAVPLPDRDSDFPHYVSVRHSTPDWLVERWIAEFGANRAESICAALNTEAPYTLRVNTLYTQRDELLRTLNKDKTVCRAHPVIPEAIEVVEGRFRLETSKPFQNGLFYVQDAASMVAAHLLGAREGDRVVDLCAAPGGKATHLAELSGGRAFVVATDNQLRKVGRARDNIERLRIPNIRLLAADGEQPPFAPGAFDAVLLDAPCSGLGTLRRRPDLKWRIQAADIERLAGQQRALLRSAAALCENGGCIVYAVCTFTPEETFGVVETITGDGSFSFEDGPEWLNLWKIETGRYRILPERGGPDGYFLTKLRKRF